MYLKKELYLSWILIFLLTFHNLKKYIIRIKSGVLIISILNNNYRCKKYSKMSSLFLLPTNRGEEKCKDYLFIKLYTAVTLNLYYKLFVLIKVVQ